jgi:hypothetical protein
MRAGVPGQGADHVVPGDDPDWPTVAVHHRQHLNAMLVQQPRRLDQRLGGCHHHRTDAHELPHPKAGEQALVAQERPAEPGHR